ncbi:MAG TPA: HAD family hydrolase [Bacteroidales bacterium]|nr:HAD family hydrolase [Bacteroidales bacterium]HRT89827.1 HAD family hydrolase [Bacteroidales bacterium]
MMKKAIFLDRDGVINTKGEEYYIYKKEDFKLNDGVISALTWFISKGYILIVVTNQGGIAKGLYTREDVEELHEFMADLLKVHGVFLTAVYYCPHHPDIEPCECRKPGTLFFEEAIKKYSISRSESWMIGDSDSDIEAAQRAGLKSVKIPTNGNMMELIVKKGIIK